MPRRKFLTVVLVGVGTAAMGGCSIISHGRWSHIPESEVDTIHIGTTTKADILQQLGQPQAMMSKPNGIEVFVYSHGLERAIALPFIISLGRVGGSGETLSISFQQGVVVDYEYKIDQRPITH